MNTHDLIRALGGATAVSRLLQVNPRTVRRWLAGDSEPRRRDLEAMRVAHKLSTKK